MCGKMKEISLKEIEKLEKKIEELDKNFYYHRNRILKALRIKTEKHKIMITDMRNKLKILKQKLKV